VNEDEVEENINFGSEAEQDPAPDGDAKMPGVWKQHLRRILSRLLEIGELEGEIGLSSLGRIARGP
jgi:hypothetical protein